MKKQRKKKSAVYANGHKLVTRRDFVAQGLAAAGGALAVPTLLATLGPKAAYANACPSLSAHRQIPFLVFDCIGGIGLSASWLALDANQQLLADPVAYRRMAILDPSNTTNEFGLPLIKGHGDPAVVGFSGFYNALTNANLISGGARANFRVGSLAAQSTNDTSLNAHHPGLLLLQSTMDAGGGELFSGGFADRQGRSGGYSVSPAVQNSHSYFGATRRTDFTEGLSYGLIAQILKPQERGIVARFLQRMSESQLAGLGNLALRDQYSHVLGCALNQNLERTEVNTRLDPLNDPDAVDVFKLNQTDLAGSRMSKARRELVAAIAYNTIMGHCAGGTVSFGGCDYHNNAMPATGAHGDNKDEEVGATLALCVELAHRKGIPLYIAIISDGSVGCNDDAANLGERRWTSDSDANGMALSCIYRPTGAVDQLRRQIGHYRMFAQAAKPPVVSADPSTAVGNSPTNVAHALFANYLALNHTDVEREFMKFVSADTFPMRLLNGVLIFDPDDKG